MTTSDMSNSKTEGLIEAICILGCQQVRQVISELEQGRTLLEVNSLSIGEQKQLLQELKSIMSVYGGNCRIDESYSDPCSGE